MKRFDRKNVDYKKITVSIPMTTYLEMVYYCEGDIYPGKKDVYYNHLINLAILDYIDRKP